MRYGEKILIVPGGQTYYLREAPEVALTAKLAQMERDWEKAVEVYTKLLKRTTSQESQDALADALERVSMEGPSGMNLKDPLYASYDDIREELRLREVNKDTQ